MSKNVHSDLFCMAHCYVKRAELNSRPEALTFITKEPIMNAQVIDNTKESRFVLVIDGEIAHADYRLSGDELYIDYVEAPPALRGTGAAGRLMEGIMTSAAEKGYSVVPICGYAAAWMRRHRKL